MRYLLLLLGFSSCFADNGSLFNQAYQAGKQNQFNLNLNSNSTIDSYGVANHFESSVANGANEGNAGAEDMYNNTYADDANPNYLYNAGTQEIQNCATQTDPRCTTLNKYGDKDTQTQLQAYNGGNSTRYYITVKPDPSDSSCSKIIRKAPINETTAMCVASAHTQSTCNATITVSLDSHECDPTNGSCSIYQNNSACQLTRQYVAPTCKSYSYKFNYGSCGVGTGSCNVPSTFNTPGCNGSGGRTYSCGSCSSGSDTGDHNGCWDQQCTSSTPGQLAAYSCKAYHYGNGCSGFN